VIVAVEKAIIYFTLSPTPTLTVSVTVRLIVIVILIAIVCGQLTVSVDVVLDN